MYVAEADSRISELTSRFVGMLRYCTGTAITVADSGSPTVASHRSMATISDSSFKPQLSVIQLITIPAAGAPAWDGAAASF